jgi:hypothetical protein
MRLDDSGAFYSNYNIYPVRIKSHSLLKKKERLRARHDVQKLSKRLRSRKTTFKKHNSATIIRRMTKARPPRHFRQAQRRKLSDDSNSRRRQIILTESFFSIKSSKIIKYHRNYYELI